MIKNKRYLIFALIATLLLVYLTFFQSPFNSDKSNYTYNQGQAQGTYYSAVYLHPEGKDLQPELEAFFDEFDASLSNYNPNSIISQINQNVDSVVTDEYFETMFRAAQQVSEKTNGAFDITCAPLVNAWGFGFGNKSRNEEPDVQSIMYLVGYNKISLENHKLIKQNPAIMLDASAIAQGLSADLIGKLFEKHGCENYMIDIGGEIVCKGKNPKGKKWQIGIDKPIDDPASGKIEIQTVLSLTNIGMTTSGNYRQFYHRGGKKYAHTIDPRKGRPVDHNLLSATVVAPDCMTADAYATAFMVLGVDSALKVCSKLPQVDCYLIYADDKGEYKTIYSQGFEKYLKK